MRMLALGREDKNEGNTEEEQGQTEKAQLLTGSSCPLPAAMLKGSRDISSVWFKGSEGSSGAACYTPTTQYTWVNNNP